MTVLPVLITFACGVIVATAYAENAAAQRGRKQVNPDYQARVDVLPAEQRWRSCGTYRYRRGGRCVDARDKRTDRPRGSDTIASTAFSAQRPLRRSL